MTQPSNGLLNAPIVGLKSKPIPEQENAVIHAARQETNYLKHRGASVQILIEDVTDERLMRRACDMTRKAGMKPSEITRKKLLRCEHSPVRLIQYWIELISIPTFVSVHLVRHKIGVEHFVESNRDDRGGAGDTEVNRLTPVNHGMYINAPALSAMSRKRLCYNSHRSTVAVWTKLRKAIKKTCPDTAAHMVPDCVYRGFCPELRECKPGVVAVMNAYKDTPMMIERIKQRTDL